MFYNDLVEHLTNCNLDPNFDCRCDIGVGSWWPNVNRTGIDFLSPHGQDSFIVLTTKDNLSVSNEITFFVKAFEPEVWILIILLSFCFIILKFLDRRFAFDSITSTTVVQEDGTKWENFKIYLLKNNLRLFRLRRAVQSTRKFNPNFYPPPPSPLPNKYKF